MESPRRADPGRLPGGDPASDRDWTPPDARPRSRIRWEVPLLVAPGVCLRVGLAIALGIDAPPAPGSDPQEYDTYAWNVAQGRGYRGMSPDVADQDHTTAYRPPGTSLVWAGLYQAFGHRYAAVRLAHC